VCVCVRVYLCAFEYTQMQTPIFRPLRFMFMFMSICIHIHVYLYVYVYTGWR